MLAKSWRLIMQMILLTAAEKRFTIHSNESLESIDDVANFANSCDWLTSRNQDRSFIH